MLVKINFQPFVLFLIAFAGVAAMMNGVIQEFVHFADPLNEIAVVVILGTFALMSLVASFEIVKQNKK